MTICVINIGDRDIWGFAHIIWHLCLEKKKGLEDLWWTDLSNSETKKTYSTQVQDTDPREKTSWGTILLALCFLLPDPGCSLLKTSDPEPARCITEARLGANRRNGGRTIRPWTLWRAMEREIRCHWKNVMVAMEGIIEWKMEKTTGSVQNLLAVREMIWLCITVPSAWT